MNWKQKQTLPKEKCSFHQSEPKAAEVLQPVIFLHCYECRPHPMSQSVLVHNARRALTEFPLGSQQQLCVSGCRAARAHIQPSDCGSASELCSPAPQQRFLTTAKTPKTQALKNHHTGIYGTGDWRNQCRTYENIRRDPKLILIRLT